MQRSLGFSSKLHTHIHTQLLLSHQKSTNENTVNQSSYLLKKGRN